MKKFLYRHRTDITQASNFSCWNTQNKKNLKRFLRKIWNYEKELEKLSIEAIEKIKKKEYASSMKFKGINDVLGVGIAFYKKKIRVKFENI